MDLIWNYPISCVLTLMAVALFLYCRWNSNFFARKGIKNIPYFIPFIGDMYSIFVDEHFIDMIVRTYTSFPDQKYIGHMQFNTPMIVIRDLDLLKQTLIKDFDHFLSHVVALNEAIDPLFGSNLFSMKGDKWRDMRATLSPAFTSSKMRNMFQLVEEIGRQMTEFYLNEMKMTQNYERGLVEIELRDSFSRYTNDVIATSVFGINVNSLADRKNEFYERGKGAADFTGKQMIKFFLTMIVPNVTKLLGINVFDPDVLDFFRTLVLGNMKQREEKNIIRHDMIHLLMQARKGFLKHETSSKDDDRMDAGFATVEESNVGKQTSKRDWTDDEIVAQAMLFFIAGFDTASTLLCFMGHELAINPEVQKILQGEIDKIVQKYGTKLEYSHLNEMKYMDMVVSGTQFDSVNIGLHYLTWILVYACTLETLRLWPPVIATDRICTRSYELPPPDDKSPTYKLEVGEGLSIPIIAIHRDPKYYPNPLKFDPERFSDENKPKLNQAAFMPFGLGPRNCIGSRFALMEAKSVIFHLLAKFDIVQTAKTDHPITLAKKNFNLRAVNGFWVGLKPRFT